MKIVFKQGGEYPCTETAAPWRASGGSIRINLTGDPAAILERVQDPADFPLRLESEDEDGEGPQTLADLTAYPVLSQVVFSPATGVTTLILRQMTEGELAEGELAELAQEQAEHLTDDRAVVLERFFPEWEPGPQTAGAVVRRSELDQVYRVLQTHDSTGNESWAPELVPALFGVCHTKHPAKAKPWAQPQGTSGAYRLGECYRDSQGQVWRQVYDGDNVYDAATVSDRWELVEV